MENNWPQRPTASPGDDTPTPEDLVLSKLEWYELGNRISESQWKDMLGILKVQKSLDWNYLEKWATELGLLNLLQKARSEAEKD